MLTTGDLINRICVLNGGKPIIPEPKSKKKIWRDWPEPCFECDGDVEIRTFADSDEGTCFTGDQLRCKSCKTQAKILVTDDDDYETVYKNSSFDAAYLKEMGLDYEEI